MFVLAKIKPMQKTRRNLSFEKLNRVATILKAISHPVRLEILEILEEEAGLSVNTIKERLKADVEQSMLSHHLIKMKDKGILTSVKTGKHIHYSIHELEVLGIFDCMEKCSTH